MPHQMPYAGLDNSFSKKIIELDERFPTGEPTIQLVMSSNGRGGRTFEKNAFDKSAASPAYDFLKDYSPKDEKTIILVNALGAYETYDANRNADAFPARAYGVGKRVTCGHTKCQAAAWLDDNETLVKHYKTFEVHGGIYKNHVNKDKTKSLGRVLKSLWNDKMQRVELVLEIDNEKDSELIKRIGDNEFPAVSMGCFQAGTKITLADGTFKLIEEIEVGDEVLTHKGNSKRVYELHRRTYAGTLYTIRPEAEKAIVCTAEHPFWVANLDDLKPKNANGTRHWVATNEVNGRWILAKELDPDKHLLLKPVSREVESADYLTYELARFLGYYLAEGSLLKNKRGELSGVEFNCHKDDELVKELPILCAKLGLRAPYKLVRAHSEVALSMSVFGAGIARLCAGLVPGKAKTKRLHETIMSWPTDFQKALIGAYANGDGCGLEHGPLQLSTSSDQLASQLKSLLPRIGVLASHQTVTHKPSKIVKKVTTEHIIYIGANWAQTLTDVCSKIKPRTPKVRRDARKIIGDYVAIPIRGISAETKEIPVYNFEVEDDNSYVAGGVAVHNCRVKWDVCTICGHRAPTRKDYCEHAKFKLRKILEDGRLVCVLNPSPQFFDISIVFRPADPTGFMLKKVAHDNPYVLSGYELGEKVAAYEEKISQAIKLSDIQKIIEGRVIAKKLSPENQLIAKYAPIAKDSAQKTDRASGKEVRAMARYSLSEVVSTLDKHGAWLGATELADVFLTRATGRPTSAATLSKIAQLQPLMVQLVAKYPDFQEKLGALVECDDSKYSAQLASELGPWLHKRATIADWLNQKGAGPGKSGEGANMGPRYRYNAAEPAKTDLMSMTDPVTGDSYQTTRGAAMNAHNQDAKNQLFGAAALTALYWLGLHYGSGKKIPHVIAAPIAGLAGWHTKNKLNDIFPAYRNPAYMTDQGVPVSGGTEFVKASSVGEAEKLNKIAADSLDSLAAPPSSNFILAGNASDEEKIAWLTNGLEYPSEDPTIAPSIDLSKLAYRIGFVLLT